MDDIDKEGVFDIFNVLDLCGLAILLLEDIEKKSLVGQLDSPRVIIEKLGQYGRGRS